MDKMTKSVIEGLNQANYIASEYGNPQIDIDHLLLGLLDDREGLSVQLLNSCGANVGSIRAELENRIAAKSKVSGDAAVYASQDLNRLLIRAKKTAKQMGDEYICRTSPAWHDGDGRRHCSIAAESRHQC